METNNNIDGEKKANTFLFKTSQFLGPPKIFPPEVHGKLPVAAQFIIPGLIIGNNDQTIITEYASLLGSDFWQIHTEKVKNNSTNEQATHATLAFYIAPRPSGENDLSSKVISISLLYVEQFLGLLSFFLGTRLSARHIQYDLMMMAVLKILPPIFRTGVPETKCE